MRRYGNLLLETFKKHIFIYVPKHWEGNDLNRAVFHGVSAARYPILATLKSTRFNYGILNIVTICAGSNLAECTEAARIVQL